MTASTIMKRAGLVVGVLLGLVLLTVAAVVLLVDPNDYRDDITTAVHDATGRELHIDGELGLSLFPWLGLTVGDAWLSNAAGFDEKEFARVAAVDVKLKLLPLLQQRVEMKTLILHGLRVNMSRASDGRSNWDDLVAPPTDTESEVTSSAEATPSAKPLAALAIGGVDIQDAHILWRDDQAKQRVEVSQLSLQTSPIVFGEPIDIQMRTRLRVSEPAVETPIELQTRVMLDPQAQRYRLKDLALSLNVASELLPVSPLNVGLNGDIDVDVMRQQMTITALTLRALGLTVDADVNVKDFLSAPQTEGQLTVNSFSPRDVAKTLAIGLPKMAGSNVLSKASVKVAFTGAPDHVDMKALNIVLDDSTVNGTLGVKHFSQPALRFDLKLDAIDVDRYLPPTTETTPPPSPAGATAAAVQLPLAPLRALDVKGNIQIGELKAANAQLTDMVIGLSAKSGVIQVAPLQANLYQGQYSGHVVMDVRSDKPKISANEKLTAVRVGPLLKDVLGEDKVSGTASVAAKVTAVGVSPEAITRSLNGSANFNFSDGAVRGINIGQMIREAYAKIKKKPAPEKTTNQTDFAEMSGSVLIENGVIHNKDLLAKSPVLRIAGKGKVDLPRERINYLLNTAIVETDQGQGGKDVSELKSLTIPIKVTGSFDKPKFKLDLEPMLKTKAKAELKRQKSKLKTKAKKKLEDKKTEAKKKIEDKLKDKLKGLFR